MSVPHSSLQLRSLITNQGQLQLSLVDTPVPAPQADEVVVRIEATPINPSDIGLLFGAADMRTATIGSGPVVTASVPERAMPAMQGRIGQSLPVGNEGAGTVVAAGSSALAQSLLGQTVA
ncbi:MAG: NADH oxidase, partial [Ideonella sp.]